MHDIWNPWHGCVKCSEGCEHCYMYFLDKSRGKNGAEIYRTGNFKYPLSEANVKSGELIRVCMTSDFFLEEADEWRQEAWDIMRRRSDVKFFLLTKRPERVLECLPSDWGDGWPNIFFNVTAENQKRAEERIPLLLQLPFQHKGVMCAPFIGKVDIEPYLLDGQIEQVICGGENYDGARPCDHEWVKCLYDACVRHDVTFAFIETGTHFIKDGKHYRIPGKALQTKQAFRSGLQYQGKPIVFELYDTFGNLLKEEDLYVPKYRKICEECGSRLICNGCSNCGQCER